MTLVDLFFPPSKHVRTFIEDVNLGGGVIVANMPDHLTEQYIQCFEAESMIQG